MEEKKIKVDIGKITVSCGDETRRVENFNGKENEKYIFLPGESFKEIIVITSADKCTHEDLALEYIKKAGLEDKYQKYLKKYGHSEGTHCEKDFLVFEYDAVATGNRERQIIISEDFRNGCLRPIINYYTDSGFKIRHVSENANTKY